MTAAFLTATWRHLAILSWQIDPSLLSSRVPRGTQLDNWNGRTFVSIVGFLFEDTRVMRLSIPFHRNFEEINLRFYVRRETGGEVRRGVVFIKEIVPRLAIALAARWFYGENYVALPTSHATERGSTEEDIKEARYEWRLGGQTCAVAVRTRGEAEPLTPGSEEEFIAQHYWGYARQRDGGTVEYQVEHTPWRVWQCDSASFEGDVRDLYGDEFAAVLTSTPSSAFLAEGSAVTVRRGVRVG